MDKSIHGLSTNASTLYQQKILVFGAGVLGSLYAARLYQAGFDVTLLARGKRLEELREYGGLRVIDDLTGKLEQIPIPITDRLQPNDSYDLVLVVVRKNQLLSVLPALAANQCTPNVLFLLNNAEGPKPIIQVLDHKRVLLGFPGAGGQRVEGVVRYRLASSVQPTTIGELDGSRSERLERIAWIFGEAGLPVAISNNIDAWLKTHVAIVSPIANALYLAGGNNYRLARTRDGLVLLIRGVKEGLRVLRALEIPITPPQYQVLSWLPEPLLVAVLQKRLALPHAELILARHANAARDEMHTLADEFRSLARLTKEPTPALDTLYTYLNPTTPIVPEGQSSIRLNWRSTIAGIGILVSVMLMVGWLLVKPPSKIR